MSIAKLFWFISFFILSLTLSAQNYFVNGSVVSSQSGEPLSFANVRVVNSNVGAAANKEGQFQLILPQGSYRLIFSFIGFRSDTVDLDLSSDTFIPVKLEPVSIELAEVTVKPGLNPALRIIRNAIKSNRERIQKINDFSFSTYTKGIIKTTKDISSSSGGVNLSLGEADTAQLKITGLLENESKGYFKKPNNYKEEIIARKQSANFPPTINTLTGGRIVQDFSRGDINFFDREMTNPVSEEGLDFYFYLLEDSLAYGGGKVYQIYFEPNDKSDPGFYGRVFITDKTFDMAKIDVNLNDAANPGGIFTRINIFQQFLPFKNDIYMPIDYRLFVEGNFLGLVKFGFEINSIMYDYQINKEIEDDFFDMAILTVLPNADEKDSTYWIGIQTIPSTLEETEAYRRIDSLESIPLTFWDRFSFLSTRQSITNNFSVTGLLGIYHFNKVEGNGLNFGFYFNDLLDRRLESELRFSNGFADKKMKYDFLSEYLLGKYRTSSISLNVFNRLDVLFSESDEYSPLSSTITSLFGKYDMKDYFYTKGINVKIESEIFPILKLGLRYQNRSEKTAFTNSDFSILNRKKKYDANRRIFDSNINYIAPSFRIDFRKYVEDGYFRRRTSQNKSYFILSGEMIVSDAKTLKSDFDFRIYKLALRSVINSFGSTKLTVNIKNVWADNAVPFQSMFALPGNLESLGRDFTFRTLNLGEIFGDKVTMLSAKYNFGDELFRALNIPIIKDLQLTLSAHFNAAWSRINHETMELNKDVFPDEVMEFRKPFYELGFSIGQIIIPLKFEFTWKLNHRGKDDFVFGFDTVIF